MELIEFKMFLKHYVKNPNAFGVIKDDANGIYSFFYGCLFAFDNFKVGVAQKEYFDYLKKRYPKWPRNIVWERWLRVVDPLDDHAFKIEVLSVIEGFANS
jgi:hypothetical protein